MTSSHTKNTQNSESTQSTQVSMYDFFREGFGVSRLQKNLERISAAIPWNTLVDLANNVRVGGKAGDVGRHGHDTLTYMKCLVLQGLYNLSDPALEDRLRDSLAFQKFIGIQDASDIPDETSICRFRNLLAEKGIQTRIFDLTVELLHTAGFEIFQGCAQDATIIEAPRGRRKKPTEIKGTDTHDTAFSTRDPEAGFTKKNDKSYHGYKGHTETSQDGKFIVSTVVTNASVHDSQMRSELLTGLETSLHGYCAYQPKPDERTSFEATGIQCHFHEKGARDHPLTPLQKMTNKLKSSIRANVEHPYSWIKEETGLRKTRYRGLMKNGAQWFLRCALYNMYNMGKILAA